MTLSRTKRLGEPVGTVYCTEVPEAPPAPKVTVPALIPAVANAMVSVPLAAKSAALPFVQVTLSVQFESPAAVLQLWVGPPSFQVRAIAGMMVVTSAARTAGKFDFSFNLGDFGFGLRWFFGNRGATDIRDRGDS